MNFGALKHTDGEANVGGLAKTGYYGFMEDVADWPALVEAVEMSDANVITGNITMKAGTGMFPMYGTPETAGLAGETQGERDARSTKRTLTWMHPGSSKEVLGFAKASLNRNMFFIVKEQYKNQFRLIGSPDYPAEVVSANDDAGTATADRKGVTFEISDVGFGPAPIYEGDIPGINDSGAGL